jgi:putative ABC transport system permease protein
VRSVFITPDYGLYRGVPDTLADMPPSWIQLAYVRDIEAHTTLLEGVWPSSPVEGADPLEVVVSHQQANTQGLQVGERLTLVVPSDNTYVPARVSGIWQPLDPTEAYWFIDPEAMEEWLLVGEHAYTQQLSRYVPASVYMGWWFLSADASGITTSDVDRLIEHIGAMQTAARDRLPNLEVTRLPLNTLLTYKQSTQLLSVLLALYSLPVLGLLAAFVALTGALSVNQQRSELAVLRSRGASRRQVIGLVEWETLLVGGVALLLSMPGSIALTKGVSRARSFLNFSAPSALGVSLTVPAFLVAVVALAIAVACQVLPARNAARNTIVDYGRERARTVRTPWWQRRGLDLVLMVVAAYGVYLLLTERDLGILSPLQNTNPFQNPLLILVPALVTLSVTLAFLRTMPLWLSAIAWATQHTRSTALLMASRHLARSPAAYTTPTLLLVITLSLATYSASLAGTLDRDLRDRSYYRVGADMMFLDIGEGGPEVTPADFRGERQVTLGAPTPLDQPWSFPPAFVYLDLPGVEDAARVGRYAATWREASATAGTVYHSGTFLGVDPGDFLRVAFWREDFARTGLGDLMARLNARADGVLVPCKVLGVHQVGDIIQLSVYTYQRSDALDFTIAGCFDLFPTWYPSDTPGAGEIERSLFVANLDYLYQSIGQTYPHEIWLGLARGVDYVDISNTPIGGTNIYKRGWGWDAPRLDMYAAQEEPHRQGLLGLLSIGFITASTLSVAGFVLYLLFSFRQRMIEFGVLRAIGLSTRQMARVLAYEIAILLIISGVLGTLLGVAISRLFIPHLQIGSLGQSTVPPYVVEIDWGAALGNYAIYGALFLIALGILGALLRRMRVFEAIKLGQTL